MGAEKETQVKPRIHKAVAPKSMFVDPTLCCVVQRSGNRYVSFEKEKDLHQRSRVSWKLVTCLNCRREKKRRLK